MRDLIRGVPDNPKVSALRPPNPKVHALGPSEKGLSPWGSWFKDHGASRLG